jgi:uncharacterized protein
MPSTPRELLDFANPRRAAFIGVLTVRDGKVALWREYQNTLAIQQALA